MAKYRMRKKKNGTYDVSCVLGEKGAVRHIGFEKYVSRQDLPAAVKRQANLAKTYRDRVQGVQATTGEQGVTQ